MKIPSHAKRVFQGVIFDVYHWEQQLFDGSIATFEALKRPDTVQVIATAGDTIYIPYEEQPHYARKYTLFGGRVEKGEEPLTAAKRELKEESGLESADWEVFTVYEIGGKIEWNLHFYLARNCKKVTDPHLDPGEKIEVKSVTFDEFIAIVCSESFGDIQFANDVLRMKLDPKKLTAFKHRLFSSQS